MAKQKTTIRQDLEIRISVNALRNLNEITGYIAFINQQPLNAIKIGDAFFSTLDKIQQNPFIFKECNELATKDKSYRQSKLYSWLIIYKIT